MNGKPLWVRCEKWDGRLIWVCLNNLAWMEPDDTQDLSPRTMLHFGKGKHLAVKQTPEQLLAAFDPFYSLSGKNGQAKGGGQ